MLKFRQLLISVCLLGGASCATAPKAGGMVSNSISPPPVETPPPSPPYPPPAPAIPPPRIVEPPRARMDFASLIHEEDYPASALANREEGRAGFTLNVLANGRVGGCVIDRSTGSSALDHATCAIMVRRARFTPARDSNGNPAAGTATGSLTWRLPRGERADGAGCDVADLSAVFADPTRFRGQIFCGDAVGVPVRTGIQFYPPGYPYEERRYEIVLSISDRSAVDRLRISQASPFTVYLEGELQLAEECFSAEVQSGAAFCTPTGRPVFLQPRRIGEPRPLQAR